MRVTLIACVLVLFMVIESNAHGERLIMPGELVEFAERNQCSQIHDFYENRPGPVNPPFAYGYLPGSEEDSAVFWCENHKNQKTPYSLILMYRQSQHVLTECPYKIPLSNPPGGLAIYKNRQTTLKGFVYLSKPGDKVPEDAHLEHNGIESYYDGVQTVFYCHRGKWLVRMRH